MPEYHHHHHHHYWRGRSRYAYRAGDPGPGPNLHRLRRSRRRAKIAGVCYGIADYFGWNVRWLRVGWIIAALVPATSPLAIISYIVLAIVMKRPAENEPRFETPEDERFWRTFSVKPKVTFSELKHRFRALDARLAEIERTVTSDEYGLRKAFQDLERGV